jgi:hypothetical protein
MQILRLANNSMSIGGIPTRVLTDSSIHTFDLNGNGIDEKRLRELSGYDKACAIYTCRSRVVLKGFSYPPLT